MSSVEFSPGGDFLLVSPESGEAQLWDLERGRAIRSLGAVSETLFSSLDRYLITDTTGGTSLSDIHFVLYDLRNPQSQTELGALSRFDFSSDERFLFMRDPADEAVVMDLRDNTRVSLGRVEEFAFSPDAQYLFLQDGHADGVLHRLTPETSRLRGASLRAGVCAASANLLRPLPQNAESGAQRATRGRPHNPCDWRGLLAVAPNAARGDGWLEGPRQWLRLMRVRHFGDADYACDETTSAASAETRARRREMCERFANQPAPAPT